MSATEVVRPSAPADVIPTVCIDLELLKQQGYDSIMFTIGNGEWRKYDIAKFADMLDCGLDFERYKKLCRHLEDSLQLLTDWGVCD